MKKICLPIDFIHLVISPEECIVVETMQKKKTVQKCIIVAVKMVIVMKPKNYEGIGKKHYNKRILYRKKGKQACNGIIVLFRVYSLQLLSVLSLRLQFLFILHYSVSFGLVYTHLVYCHTPSPGRSILNSSLNICLGNHIRMLNSLLFNSKE